MLKSYKDAQVLFEECWRKPNYTQIELHDVDVNKTLLNYKMNKPIIFTRSMLWDMETKKAWNPGKYIPYVIRQGSEKAWGKHPSSGPNGEIFVRSSFQKQWLNPDIYEEVFEEVYVNNEDQLITFIGTINLPERSDQLNPKQPIFHVQHGVAGTENQPLNTWRIVHLTPIKDKNLIALFSKMNDPNILPGFIKSYIENDLATEIEEKLL
jgi:hypothetical protein